MVCLWIRAFFAPEQFPWQQIGTGIPQQGFFDSIPIFHLPRHIENIFHDPVIGKWDTGFQRRVHAGAVHAVEQGLHEPFDIQIANVTTAGFLRGFAIQMRNVGECFLIACMRIFCQIQRAKHVIGKNGGTCSRIGRPRKTIPVHKFRSVKPWIAAENFIGTFSGECYFIMFGDFGTKIQKRGVHIGHSGKVFGGDRIGQGGKESLLAAL